MCGIVGYVGKQKVGSILLEGLKRLEYRGYDSAGMAFCTEQKIEIIKKSGRVEVLADLVNKTTISAKMGISHTRWATHGKVSDQNAHPHLSMDGKIAVVHNGVIENYQHIAKFLEGHAYYSTTETDTEVLTNLIAYHYNKEPKTKGKGRFFTSVRKALAHVEGTYGIAVICIDCPGAIVGARKGSPLIVGIGKGENMLASDVSAFAGRTQNVIYLDEGQVVHLTESNVNIVTQGDKMVSPVIDRVDWELENVELGCFTHFMEKEIFEQPIALENAMRGRFSDDGSTACFGGLNMTPRELRQIDRIVFCGCGTARHACLVAEHYIERYARIPVEVEYSSEFRYRNAPLDKNTLIFIISQSGETIDSLEAQREARRKGYRTLGITNTVGSTIARENDGGVFQHSGREIGVASTKAFTAQLLVSAMIALYLGRLRDLSFSEGVSVVEALRRVPGLVSQVLDRADAIKKIATAYASCPKFLFLGRQQMFPIALEGALKLKEISYVYAAGYPAAEMKHGPIALIGSDCPCVVFAPEDEVFAKVLGNIQEIKARGGPVIAITDAGKNFPREWVDEVIDLPASHECVKPLLFSIPIQLFAYFIALEKGCDVDKPRNLAKAVTVE